MIIKKYQGSTEEEASALAKEDLGKEAVIMNVKLIQPRGIYKLWRKTIYEVTAALEEVIQKPEFAAHIPKEPLPEVSADKLEFMKKNQIIPEEEPKKESQTSAIEERLNNLQNLLEKQMNHGAPPEEDLKLSEENESLEQPEVDKNKECIQLIYTQLIQNEVDEVYADQITADIEKNLSKDSSVDNILSSVYQKIILKIGQPKVIESESGKQKVVFFIGPTGVGKTTTIAKIASTFKVGGQNKIALITSDTYRIAAVEQLRTYANILGIPLRVIYGAEEMASAREEYADKELILVDTAGRSHKNREQRDDLEQLLASVPEEEREVYLVLSATTKYSDLLKITEAYKTISDYNLIFTKLDETDNIGHLFNLRMATGAPLSYTTWGQNVPDDLGKVDAQKIAKQLLGGSD